MSTEKLYSTFAGKTGGAFEGRTFARISGYMATSREVLVAAGAEMKGPTSYLLPAGQEDEIIAKLDETTVADKAQALADRTPVKAADAAALKIGDEFDFGGAAGKAPIVGIGAAFTPKKDSVHDERLTSGDETVYVYNANAPKSAMPKPELTDEEKAARDAQRLKNLEGRDKTRLPVLEGTAGETVSVGGQDVAVTGLGRAWELEDQGAVDALVKRFPETEFKVGDKVQFAKFAAPEPVEEPSM